MNKEITGAIEHTASTATSTIQAVGTQAESSVTAAVAATGASATDILKTYMVKALEATGNVLERSVDMVMEQAPILVQEVLHWYFAYNLFVFVVALLGMFAIFAFWYQQFVWGTRQEKLNKCDQSKWYNNGDYEIIRMLFIIMLAIPFIMFAAKLNLEWLKIYIAPRLWLIEYASALVTK